MKKLMTLLILLTMALSLTVSASDEGVVSMNAHELLLSLEVTLTSNVTINPNAIGTEEDIISGTALKIKNNTFIDIDAYIVDIDSPYNSLFVEYSDNSIIWKNLGHTDTLKYIAFSAESKDIIPNQEVLLGPIPNRRGLNEKYVDINVKSGYTWKSTDTLNRVYPITMIFRIDDEEMPQYLDDPVFLDKPTYIETSYSSVLLSAQVNIPQGHGTISYGFKYCAGSGEPNIDVTSSATFKSPLIGLITNQLYTFQAYVVTEIGTYYSETETIYIIPAATPTITLDKTTLIEDSLDIGTITDSIVVTLSNGTFTPDLTGLIQVNNLPNGLTATLTRLNATQVMISFGGAALAHSEINSIPNASISIDKSAIKDNKDFTPFNNLTSSSVTFTFKDSIAFTGFTVDKFGHFEATVSANGVISERGFIYLKDGGTLDINTPGISKSIVGSGVGSYFVDILTLEELKTYKVRAYVKIGSEYFYSNNTLSILTATTFSYTIDLDLIPTNTYQFYTSSTAVGGFKVDWGDGQVETFSTTGIKAHNYDTSGIKEVSIIADKLNIDFYSNSSSICLITVSNALPMKLSGTNISNMFRGQKYLTTIPSNLLYNRIDEYILNSLFQGCTSLESIPIGLFDNNTVANEFNSVFSGCSSLTEIPEGLFDKNTNAATFSYTFQNCSKITGSIPTGLFNYNTKVGSFLSTFSGCSSLTGSIPEGLFDKNTSVIYFSNTFAGCSSLTGSIPEGLFNYNTKVIYMDSIFRGCSSLTGSIPEGLFDKNTLVTDFSYAFYKCSKLTGSIPEGLFSYNTKVTSFQETFYGCSSLTGSIPEGLFDKNTLVTKFLYTFYGCSSLTGSIPEGLFDKNTLVTDFSYTFQNCSKITGSIPKELFSNNILATSFLCTFSGCSSLTEIPEGLFDKNLEVTDFGGTFSGCSSLTEIPKGLFDKNPLVTNFGSTFNNNSSLATIPEGLFDKNTLVDIFAYAFQNCSSLTTIPEGLFDKNTSVVYFSSTFTGCSSLTEIPEGLFDYNTKVIYMDSIFEKCSSLINIPVGLFDKNTLVTNFGSTFRACSSLINIPVGLFDKNTLVTYFNNTFYNCSSLTTIPEGLFDKNTLVTSFSYTFYGCSQLNGTAPSLWLRNPAPVSTQCFRLCTKLSNYASIPTAWK